MLGKYTVGKKALKFGYKRYGIPGAVASGGAALLGYLAVKRALRSRTGRDDPASVIDPEAVKRVVDEKGVGAVTDPKSLGEVVDESRLNEGVGLDEVGSAAGSEADRMADDPDTVDIDVGDGDGDEEGEGTKSDDGGGPGDPAA
jgi:hypothetical protein